MSHRANTMNTLSCQAFIVVRMSLIDSTASVAVMRCCILSKKFFICPSLSYFSATLKFWLKSLHPKAIAAKFSTVPAKCLTFVYRTAVSFSINVINYEASTVHFLQSQIRSYLWSDIQVLMRTSSESRPSFSAKEFQSFWSATRCTVPYLALSSTWKSQWMIKYHMQLFFKQM